MEDVYVDSIEVEVTSEMTDAEVKNTFFEAKKTMLANADKRMNQILANNRKIRLADNITKDIKTIVPEELQPYIKVVTEKGIPVKNSSGVAIIIEIDSPNSDIRTGLDYNDLEQIFANLENSNIDRNYINREILNWAFSKCKMCDSCETCKNRVKNLKGTKL